MVKRSHLSFLSLLLLFGHASVAQAQSAAAPQQQPGQAQVKASPLNYLVFLPKRYAPKGEPVPMILFLHGSGERGTDINKVKLWGPPALVEKNAGFPFLVVSPQSPDGEWWHATQLKALLDQVLATYNVDRRRIYLTGLSMGGYGAWDLAQRYPDYFAALAPVCGGGYAVPSLMQRIKHIPTWVFHGKKDAAVPEQQSAVMVEALRAAGGNVRYTVLPEGGHAAAWLLAYGEAGLFDWFLQQRRAAP